MTTQLFVASTAFGVATIAAATRDCLFGEADRRVLVVSNNAAVPEAACAIDEVSGMGFLLRQFDEVHSYNASVAPQHPSAWVPRKTDLPIWERYFRHRWGLGDDPVHLVVESIQAAPALTLAQIFADATIEVYADGLMSYGPTRVQLPSQVGSRVTRLLHLDLVPGLAPTLLTEWGVAPQLISRDSFRAVVADVVGHAGSQAGPQPGGQVAVLLGQYLAAAGILTHAEELELHLRMIRGSVARGHRTLVFKPHPTAPPLSSRQLVVEAERLGATLEVRAQPELAEALFATGSIGLVVGCFSTALMTARYGYGLATARVGTELLLERLRPYENSNRIPVTLVDALVPPLEGTAGSGFTPREELPGDAGELTGLVAAVSYAMQPKLYPQLRAGAESFLAEHLGKSGHYFKRRRLTALGLPGMLPRSRDTRLRSTGRQVVRRARRLIAALSLLT